MPAASLLPAAAAWMSASVRGVLAMAPPPPFLVPPPIPCPGAPPLNSGSAGALLCGPCPYDASKLCAFTDPFGAGNTDYFQYPGDPSSWSFTAYDSSYRGFDDPQADPNFSVATTLYQSVQIRFVRADLYDFGFGTYQADDTATGNPPWGSVPPSDMDADGATDPAVLTNRHNQGSYAARYDDDTFNAVLGRPDQFAQQFPDDAFAEPSCPGVANCDIYTTDCGGISKYSNKAPTGYVPYPSAPPNSPGDWPVIPIPRDWKLGSDAQSVPAIKRLLRFSSSIVNYDSTQPHMSEYSLAENANDVVVTAPGTPIAGVLMDAYNYFKNTVFTELDDSVGLNCRNHIIVYVTDGFDECNSNACAGGPTGKGPSGDLGALPLPDVPFGSRASAHALDSSIGVTGVPVYMVALGLDPNDPKFQCIATNTGGRVFGATDRASLKQALQSILSFKLNAAFFAAPSVPAFAGGSSDTAQVGAVIPSHLNEDGTFSSWAIWAGSLKSFKLDSNGNIPVLMASGPTPTPTPVGPTPAAPVLTYPDEQTPNDASVLTRRPVWNAARVLGYTDPAARLTEDQAPSPASPAAKAPEIDVWPGRKLLWATGAGGATVPLTRNELMPNTAPCTGTCFASLVTAMGLNPLSVPDQTQTINVVNFLRGGVSTLGSRDEVLNLDPNYTGSGASKVLIGPNVGQRQLYSSFFQDDTPAPGLPQFRTDGESVPDGYAHKLGDIFHSDPIVVQPPRFFQFLSANLAPNGKHYTDFVSLHARRRRVLFAGANDGFLHAFDGGVWGRDATNFPSVHDLGTGREIFGYALNGLMKNAPSLIAFPPQPQYFMDGSLGTADVFIDTSFAVAPNNGNRDWKTVLVGSLRQGGQYVYALDVTYPDAIDTATANPTFGEIMGGKDNSPGCLDGGGTGCPHPYPQILWELTDDCSVQPATCVNPIYAKMGETWSRPVVGRIKILNGVSTEDRYVAVFGGGDDPTFLPLDTVLDADQLVAPFKKATRGRSFYMVDVETGKILYKAVSGVDGAGATFKFAPMPAPPALADTNDDGYLDLAYIGDINGQMWRIDLTPDATATPRRGDLVGGVLTGYQPFLLFRTDPVASPQPSQPIFLEAGIIYLAGGPRPTLGVAFGTGNRRDLASLNAYCATPPCPPNMITFFVNRFYFVVDTNQTYTATEDNLRNISPPNPSGGANSGCAVAPCTGYFLDFGSPNEKATSTVTSTQGYLALISYTPDGSNPCSTEGSSYRYRFFFLNGQGGYNISVPAGTYADYRQYLGLGTASGSQSTSPSGNTIDTVLFSGGALTQQNTASSLNTINVNWKENPQ